MKAVIVAIAGAHPVPAIRPRCLPATGAMDPRPAVAVATAIETATRANENKGGAYRAGLGAQGTQMTRTITDGVAVVAIPLPAAPTHRFENA